MIPQYRILRLKDEDRSNEMQHRRSHDALIDLVYEDIFARTYHREAVLISVDGKGKPNVDIEGSSFQGSVSISHTSCFVFVAASKGAIELGVDVERVRDFSVTLLDGFLSVNERDVLTRHSLFDSSLYHTKIWCLKESILKALGTGLRVHPQSLDVSSLLFLKAGESGFFYRDGNVSSCTIFCSEERDGYMFVGLSIPRL